MRSRQTNSLIWSVPIAVAMVLMLLPAGTVFAGQKVDICHVPPGNPANFHTITISENAQAAHLAHGDLAGPCPTTDCFCEGLMSAGILPAPSDWTQCFDQSTESPFFRNIQIREGFSNYNVQLGETGGTYSIQCGSDFGGGNEVIEYPRTPEGRLEALQEFGECRPFVDSQIDLTSLTCGN